MKILIAIIAVLLNVHGFQALSKPHIFNKHGFEDPYPRRHHEHHRHHHNEGSVLTTDDLADVLLSLPGSLGKEAYKTFLALGQFLPADTKAHKFFTSIPKAIRRKTNDQFASVPTMSNTTSTQFSPNSMFMMQPDGYRMVPLPLHPMFSSSPLDYVTRVPCRHTKVIRVPMHTFDVQISAITRKFSPSSSSFDDSEDDDDDDDDDNMNSGLKDLLDLISSDDDDESEISGDKKSSEEADSINSQPDNEKPSPKLDDDSKNELPKLDDDSKNKEPLPTELAEGNPETSVEDSADESLKKGDEQQIEENPAFEEGNGPAAAPASGEGDESATPPASEEEDKRTTEPISEEEDTSAPAPPAAEVESTKQEDSALNETQSQEAESVSAASKKFDKKKKKKPAPKKGKAAEEVKTKSDSETEPGAATGSSAELDEDSLEEVSKPIQTKKGKKKKPKQQ